MLQILDDMETPSLQWLVLETPRPEEIIVAAVRIKFETGLHTSRKATIDIFGSANNLDIKNSMLARIERICKSQGCSKIVFEVPHWTLDTQDWLSTNGYCDLGGYEWPSELQHKIFKHTVILQFEVSKNTT
jgi:hypothetical protein